MLKYIMNKIEDRKNKQILLEKEEERKLEYEEEIKKIRAKEWEDMEKRFSDKGYIVESEFDWHMGEWYYFLINKNNLTEKSRLYSKSKLEDLSHQI